MMKFFFNKSLESLSLEICTEDILRTPEKKDDGKDPETLQITPATQTSPPTTPNESKEVIWKPKGRKKKNHKHRKTESLPLVTPSPSPLLFNNDHPMHERSKSLYNNIPIDDRLESVSSLWSSGSSATSVNGGIEEYINQPTLKRRIRQDVLNDVDLKQMFINNVKKDLLNDEEIRKSLMKDIQKEMEREKQENLKLKLEKEEEEKNANNLQKATSSRGLLFPWDNDPTSGGSSWMEHGPLERTRGLENDTFTLMMLSTRYGLPWIFLFCLFLVQACLLMGILIELVFPRDGVTLSRTLGVAMANKFFVTIGQCLAIIFALFSQRDLLEGVAVFLALCKVENWVQLNRLQDDKKVRWSDGVFWVEKIFFTYFLKLSVSLLTLFTAMILILQSSDLIDLLKDFTALFIVASLDNFVFASIGDGYFGHLFDRELKRKQRIKIKAETRFTFCLCKKIPVQTFIFGLLLVLMLTVWGHVAYMQRSGAFFFESHRMCNAFENGTNLRYEYWGDGTCDPRLYTENCGMDGGDCNDYCMTKWMTPNYATWLAVEKVLKKERSESCLLDSNVISAFSNGTIDVKGLKPIYNVTFNHTDLYGEFSKCFDDSSIYNEDDSKTLSLFCFFGSFSRDFSSRKGVSIVNQMS